MPLQGWDSVKLGSRGRSEENAGLTSWERVKLGSRGRADHANGGGSSSLLGGKEGGNRDKAGSQIVSLPI